MWLGHSRQSCGWGTAGKDVAGDSRQRCGWGQQAKMWLGTAGKDVAGDSRQTDQHGEDIWPADCNYELLREINQLNMAGTPELNKTSV